MCKQYHLIYCFYPVRFTCIRNADMSLFNKDAEHIQITCCLSQVLPPPPPPPHTHTHQFDICLNHY